MKPSIQVEHVAKVFRISHEGTGRKTFREAIMDAAAAPWRRVRSACGAPTAAERAQSEDVWALRDISFHVAPGEVIGVLGRNGAGKSTLLKILSRITRPTSGGAKLRGRVGSLLEVGTGFHQELSGRENIFLNGAILGMTRREIAKKFDEIVAFSELERFLDTPVKRYSSGMYMRLAFAVAAHLEPEILLVDEVLAVGDAAFQKKCLGKMDQVSRSGRTVLFVSHNMAAVKSLCSRALLIEDGRVACDGAVDEAVERYLRIGAAQVRGGDIPPDCPRLSNGSAVIRSVRVTDLDGNDTEQLYFGQPFRVSFVCDVLRPIDEGLFEVSISAMDGAHVSCAMTVDGGGEPQRLEPGRYEVSARFDNPLLPRRYTVDLGVHAADGTTADFVQRTTDFVVLRVAERGAESFRWATVRGYVRANADWAWKRTERSDGVDAPGASHA